MVLTPFHSSDHITAEIVTTMRLPTHFEHHASTSSLTDWCLFEICNDYNIERPIRDWESVLDIMSGWDILPSSSTSASDQQQQQTRNAILLKRYPLRDSIAVKVGRSRRNANVYLGEIQQSFNTPPY